jgi:hypothetical protein
MNLTRPSNTAKSGDGDTVATRTHHKPNLAGNNGGCRVGSPYGITHVKIADSRDSLRGMTAQIGAGGLDPLGDPNPVLLAGVARVQPQPGGEWVDLGRLGFHSTQRLHLSDLADGVAVVTWPAELAPQARYLYGRGLGSAVVAAAIERGWTVEPRPHLAYHTAAPSRRLYMRPAIAPLDYVASWQDQDGLRRVGSHAREDVEHELWPWLKQKGFADDGDDTELRLFLDQCLRRRPAHMRPGLGFRRAWTSAEAAELGPALADTIRSEFDSVFAIGREPTLDAADIMQLKARDGGNSRVAGDHIDGFAREAIPERVRHEVWRRDRGRCVDCGSRQRLEFDHIIPISKGGSNTARNIELRCEGCNRRKGASI